MSHKMWVVTLVKEPPLYSFRSDYFPRRIYYKRDAMELVREVADKGGEARVEKEG